MKRLQDGERVQASRRARWVGMFVGVVSWIAETRPEQGARRGSRAAAVKVVRWKVRFGEGWVLNQGLGERERMVTWWERVRRAVVRYFERSPVPAMAMCIFGVVVGGG